MQFEETIHPILSLDCRVVLFSETYAQTVLSAKCLKMLFYLHLRPTRPEPLRRPITPPRALGRAPPPTFLQSRTMMAPIAKSAIKTLDVTINGAPKPAMHAAVSIKCN